MALAAHAAGPVRTCLGCRRRAPQAALVRVALVNGRPVADPRRRLPGRGGYVHPVQSCVRRASAPGVLERAFRTRLRGPVDLMGIEDLVSDGQEEDPGFPPRGGARDRSSEMTVGRVNRRVMVSSRGASI